MPSIEIPIIEVKEMLTKIRVLQIQDILLVAGLNQYHIIDSNNILIMEGTAETLQSNPNICFYTT